MSQVYTRRISIFCSILILIVLFLHIFRLDFLSIDTITIWLIALLLVSLLVPYINKFKLGEFEAEIGSSEVKRLEKAAEQLPISEDLENDEFYFEDELYDLLETNPSLALAKLRIELEQVLRKVIMKKTDIKTEKIGIGQMSKIMEKHAILDNKYLNIVGEVTRICNRAIHGEKVNQHVAERIVEIGMDLIDFIYNKYLDTVLQPIKEEEISPNKREMYQDAVYEVNTIVPLVEKPLMKKYIFTQEELDDFLQDYGTFAEFIIEIKKKNSKVKRK